MFTEGPALVDAAVVALTEDIRQAFYKSCPEKVNKFRKRRPFSQEMLKLVKEKRRLRREKANLRRNGDLVRASFLQREINKMNNELKKLQKIKHKETLLRQCQELNKEKDSKRFYARIQHILIGSQCLISCILFPRPFTTISH